MIGQDLGVNYCPIRNYKPEKLVMDSISYSFILTSNRVEGQIKERKVRHEVTSSILELSSDFLKLDSLGLLMSNDTISKYINKLTDKIVERNKNINVNHYKVFVYRTESPNAYSYGEHVILINLGMLARLQSESELAFIICHEIAHDIKNHMIEGIINRAKILYNLESQKQIKKIRKMEYNRLSLTREFISKYRRNYTEHSRENEFVADSIGLILFANAGYLTNTVIGFLNKLDTIDYPLYFKKIDFPRLFNSPNFSFKENWLHSDQNYFELGTNIYGSKSLPDSMKSHPNCIVRSKKIAEIIYKKNLNTTAVLSFQDDYFYFKQIVLFEFVEYYLDQNNYSLALFNSIQLLNQYTQNNYLRCSILYCLYKIYCAKERHELSSVVDLPSRNYSTTYNDLLYFIQNVSLSTLKLLCHDYLKTQVSIKDDYANFVNLLINGFDQSKSQFETAVRSYEKQNSSSFYCQKLKMEITDKK